jgi:hypothetical protein
VFGIGLLASALVALPAKEGCGNRAFDADVRAVQTE